LKCVPLLHSLSKRKIRYHLILTGQNKTSDLVASFNIPRYDIIQLKAFENVKLNPIRGLLYMPSVISELKDIFNELDIKTVVFHGDTASTLAACLASRGLVRMHIESGLRSGSLMEPIPEEFFRKLVDHASDVLFAPSSKAAKNLIRERVRGEILLVGNPIVDLVNMALEKIRKPASTDKFVLMTAHRYENIFSAARLKRIIEIARLCKFPVYWSIHELTKRQLIKFGLWGSLRAGNINPIDPLNYFDFIEMMIRSEFVLTDGGGIEEECTILGKSCILLRKRTEWGEGIKMGITFLVGLDLNTSETIIRMLENNFRTVAFYRNPYVFFGSPSELIANYIAESSSDNLGK
jgi:UDP-N-acetylglucosamine 2-epimerase